MDLYRLPFKYSIAVSTGRAYQKINLYGALCSMFMITLVLPSVLYVLDNFVLKLSLKKK